MEHVDDPFESSSSPPPAADGGGGRDEPPEDLLEECWFFGNLLDKRTKTMSRCYSDPCPSSSSSSSNYGQDMVITGWKPSSVKKLMIPDGHGAVRPNLKRTPSLPPCRTRAEEARHEKKSNPRAMISNPTSQSLLRTPSLPVWIGREEDAESDFELSKLIRQASLNSSDVLPPRHTSKGMKESSSSPWHHRLRQKPGLESIDLEQTKVIRKSPSDLESEQVQGFKELGFKFNRKASNSVKSRVESIEDKVRRPYLSEAWLVQSSAPPPIPNWADKSSSSSSSSSAEDMKAQIKFWARAVAANVR